MEFEEVRYGMLMMVLCDRWGMALRQTLCKRVYLSTEGRLDNRVPVCL